jgi:hypothetical protein
MTTVAGFSMSPVAGFLMSFDKRFVNGANIRGITQLRAIHRMLQQMPECRPYLGIPGITDVPSAFAAFFAPHDKAPARYSIDQIGESLAHLIHEHSCDSLAGIA